jgi:hypothetical protein
MKADGYTIRAQLGSVENPFGGTGLASASGRSITGSLTASAAASVGASTSDQTVRAATGAVVNDQGPGAAATASSTELDTGVKIGIGVGVDMGVVIFLAVIAWTLRKRHVHASKVVGAGEAGRSELESKGVMMHEAKVERHSRHELAGCTKPELDGTPRSELAGDTTREAGGDMGLQTDGIHSEERDRCDNYRA